MKKGTFSKSLFGQLSTGESAELFTLTNNKGSIAKITNYGAALTELWMPDNYGQLANVVLGYDQLDLYEKESPYFGATVGRYANRIAKGHFTLNGKMYSLARNNNGNHLHGGPIGFSKQIWQSQLIHTTYGIGLEMTYQSEDGEEGFPGNLTTIVRYILTDKNALEIEYQATTDQITIINLTHHSYFNLSGQGDILDHVLTIDSDATTEVNKDLIPTGKIITVDNTPFDFRQPTVIGQRINAENEQLKFGSGYDHNWVINQWNGGLREVGALSDSESGRRMTVQTTEPGIQIYTGNFLSEVPTGKGSTHFVKHAGVCLETQRFPDTPNHGHFPACTLEPDEVYRQKTIYQFMTH